MMCLSPWWKEEGEAAMNHPNDTFRRLLALTTKEFLQLMRDQSSILMGIFLPLLLIFIMGYGMSLDVKNVPVAVVMEDTSPTARDMASFTEGSEYFSPVYVRSMKEAEGLMRNHEVDGILWIPSTFTSDFAKGRGKMQLILNGVEATTASAVQGYVEAAVLSKAAEEGAGKVMAGGSISVVSRIWFNDANTSSWFFVPGILMMVMTTSGVFLTAVVMAREWERGTFESLFVSPVRSGELILAKIIPYFCIASAGMGLCLAAGVFIYDLPMRGSLLLITGISMIYIVIALGIGLVISAVTKNQFLACQVSLIISFLPSVMLSGFIFDLKSMPAAARMISQLFPATYYLQLMRTLFLAGNYWPEIIRNGTILLAMAVFFMSLAFHLTRKELDS